MKSILDVGKDLVVELRKTGNPKLLIDLFEIRTKSWKYSTMHVEGGTIGIFSDLHDFAYDRYGFELIPTAIKIVIEQKDSDMFSTALSMLNLCIHESNTTEMPNELLEQWDNIGRMVDKIGDRDSILFWNDISRWYRKS